MTIAILLVSMGISGILFFLMGKLWEQEHGEYRKRYDLLTEMLSLIHEAREMKKKMEQGRFLSPVQVGDL